MATTNHFSASTTGLSRGTAPSTYPDEVPKLNFVYVLRLRGALNAFYVGMTGLHPYQRYLNHIRGYKSSKVAKKRATAIIDFEGPMPKDQAVAREVSLAEELRANGNEVFGGH